MSKEKVLNLLRRGPMKSGEVAEKLSLDKKEVDKIIKDLKKEGKIESPKRCYYSAK